MITKYSTNTTISAWIIFACSSVKKVLSKFFVKTFESKAHFIDLNCHPCRLTRRSVRSDWHLQCDSQCEPHDTRKSNANLKMKSLSLEFRHPCSPGEIFGRNVKLSVCDPQQITNLCFYWIPVLPVLSRQGLVSFIGKVSTRQCPLDRIHRTVSNAESPHSSRSFDLSPPPEPLCVEQTVFTVHNLAAFSGGYN